MNYSITQLSTVTDCDIVLTEVQKQKEDLEYARTSKERSRITYAERSVQTDADLLAINGEVSSLQTVLASLPEGDTKEEMEVKLKKLEYRQFLLKERNEDYGLVALLDRELDVAFVDAQLAEINTFIAQVEAHKATL